MSRFNKYAIPLLILFIGITLLLRLYLSFVRYFDPDEFAHLHWTYLLSTGKLPYRDIFMYHIPFYQLLLLPFFILPQSAAVLVLVRIFTFLIYISNLYLLYLTVKKLSGKIVFALLSVCILSVFPMTMDKSIDIRPDMVMVLLFQASLYLLVRKNVPSRMTICLSGLAYGLSLLTFPKIIYGLPPLLFLLFFHSNAKNMDRKYPAASPFSLISAVKHLLSINLKSLSFFALCVCLPFLVFLVYLYINGIAHDAFIAVMKDSVAVTAGKWKFTPWLALSPWPLVYVARGGASWPWIVNCALYILSALGLFVLFVNFRRLFYISFLFLSGGILLLFLFPSPYLQYFMPITVFAAIPSAAFIHFLHEKTGFFPLIFMFLIALSVSFIQQFLPRIKTDSKEQVTVISDLLKISRPHETFFDLVGSYVFRPDAYFLCCHPYVEFSHLLNRKPPPLASEIIRTRTRFLIMDRTGLLYWKTPEPDVTFLRNNYLASNYRKIYTLGWQFKCESNKCIQHDVDGKAIRGSEKQVINVPFEENFRIRLDPPAEQVIIDGREAPDRISLPKGTHSFSVSPGLKFFEVQLDR